MAATTGLMSLQRASSSERGNSSGQIDLLGDRDLSGDLSMARKLIDEVDRGVSTSIVTGMCSVLIGMFDGLSSTHLCSGFDRVLSGMRLKWSKFSGEKRGCGDGRQRRWTANNSTLYNPDNRTTVKAQQRMSEAKNKASYCYSKV